MEQDVRPQMTSFNRREESRYIHSGHGAELFVFEEIKDSGRDVSLFSER